MIDCNDLEFFLELFLIFGRKEVCFEVLSFLLESFNGEFLFVFVKLFSGMLFFEVL